MKRKKKNNGCLVIAFIAWVGVILSYGLFERIPEPEEKDIPKKIIVEAKTISTPTPTPSSIVVVRKKKKIVKKKDDALSYKDKKYMAQCMMAEAQDQGEHGMRLVCDVILNRLNSNNFPDSITGVINQRNAFEVVAKGTIYDMTPTEEVYKIIDEEWKMRYNTDILYFRMNHYHSFGTPCFQYKDHYFSK